MQIQANNLKMFNIVQDSVPSEWSILLLQSVTKELYNISKNE